MSVWARAAISVAVLLGAIAPRAECAETWSPQWVTELAEGVEWVASAPSDDATALLAADTRGGVRVLRLSDGNAACSDTAAACGVRPIRSTTGRSEVVCLDAHGVYAFDLGGDPRLRWRTSPEPVVEAAVFPEDPEFLTRFLDAVSTPAGVFVALDGHIALLDAATGAERWAVERGRLGVARLLAHGEEAVLLWRADGRTRAEFLARAPAPARRKPIELGADWPIWSELTPDGLVTVNGSHVRTTSRGGERREFEVATTAPLRAACLAAVPAEQVGRASRLWLWRGPSSLAAFELERGRCVFPPTGSAMPTPRYDRLRSDGAWLIGSLAGGVEVWDTSTGARRHAPWPTGYFDLQLIDAAVRGEEVLTMCTAPGTGDARDLVLLRAPLCEESQPAPMRPDRIVLDASAEVRQVLWLAERAIVAGRSEIRAFRLQRAAPVAAREAGPRPPGEIAFMRGGRVLLASAAGGAPRELARERRYAADRGLTWLPDGSGLLYLDHSGPGWAVHRVGVPDGLDLPLIIPESGGCRSPSVSADGLRIAYMRDDPAGLWVIDASPNRKHDGRPLSLRGHRDERPAWSPDGSRIAFTDLVSTADQRAMLEVWLIDAESREERRLATNAEGPSWSPDGARVYCTGLHDGRRAVLAIERDSGKVNALTSRDIAAYGAAASPDGAWVAFVARRGREARIAIVPGDGGEVRELALFEGESGFGGSLTWSPDSQWVAYCHGEREAERVEIVSVDGRSRRTVAEGGARCPAWRPGAGE